MEILELGMMNKTIQLRNEEKSAVKTYRIADINVLMDTFGRTAMNSIPYIYPTEDQHEIIIQSENDKVKRENPMLSENNCEYLGSGRNYYKKIIAYNGMMLHSSAIIFDGKAYLFTADKGTGKSTHTSNWRCVFGDERVRILNDDKPALRLLDGVWYAYGTPWCGKTGQNLNLRAPIAGIAEVVRGDTTEIRRMDKNKAVHLVLKQTCIPDEIQMRIKLLELVDKLVEIVPFWELKCTKEPSAANVAYEAMATAME